MKVSRLRGLSAALIVVGILVTSYLSYLKLTDEISICLSGGMINCEAVLNSRFSEIMILGGRVPIAYLGLLVYLVLLAIWFWESRNENAIALTLFFGLSTFAWLYSMYLVYLQFFVLRAACPWCLTHEANITLLFIITLLGLRRKIKMGELSA